MACSLERLKYLGGIQLPYCRSVLSVEMPLNLWDIYM